MTLRASALALLVLLCSCKKKDEAAAGGPRRHKIGLVTDVGGRGDQSFNDSALRGLELWSAGKRFAHSGYQPVPADEVQKSLAADLAARVPPIAALPITPVVLQSKVQEDYEPNLQLLVDQGMELTVGVGFMLENAVEAVARRNADAQFLLIDSPLLDAQAKPYTLPNVRTVIFREEQGSFLVGAIAGLVSRTSRVGFVGGMEIPLIKKFEAGFRAGLMTTNPEAARSLLVSYTGSFDNVGAGKQVAQDLVTKGADVVFHAAGSDGLGVIQAVKEARAGGKNVYAIGCDSDQSHLAPEAVLTSMVKRVDLAVYKAASDLVAGRFTAGDTALGLREAGVAYAEIRVDLPGKAKVLARVEALRQQVIDGTLVVPSTAAELAAFKSAP